MGEEKHRSGQADREKLRRVRHAGHWSFLEAARVGEAPQVQSKCGPSRRAKVQEQREASGGR